MADKHDRSGFEALKKGLENGKIGNLYVLWGGEDYLRDYYLGELRSKLLAPGFEEFNHKRFEGKGFEVRDLCAAVDALPAFSDRTLTEVRDFDIFKAGDAVREEILRLVSDLPDYCCLVFVYTSPDFKPDARTKVYSLITQLGVIAEFAAQDERRLINWIKKRFGALGHTIGSAAAAHLIELCGDRMSGLIPEIEKIGAYAKTEEVAVSDIDAAAAPLLDAVVFRMTDAVADGNFDEAVRILGDLLAMRESPIMILAVLGKQMRRIYAARAALDAGEGKAYIKKMLNLKYDFQAERLIGSAGRVSAERLRETVRLSAETDYMMKSSSENDEDLLKILIARIAYA